MAGVREGLSRGEDISCMGGWDNRWDRKKYCSEVFLKKVLWTLNSSTQSTDRDLNKGPVKGSAQFIYSDLFYLKC